jgi:17beta-estradiol 17-dehydrogenase / very-long-chain 3-oxoacyl-CoA reductase
MISKTNAKKLLLGTGALTIAGNVANAVGGLHKYVLLKRLDLHARYQGGWVLVTGATNGIGKAYAIELAKEGFNILLVSRNQEKLDEVAREIKQVANVEVRTIAYNYYYLNSPDAIKEYIKLMEE